MLKIGRSRFCRPAGHERDLQLPSEAFLGISTTKLAMSSRILKVEKKKFPSFDPKSKFLLYYCFPTERKNVRSSWAKRSDVKYSCKFEKFVEKPLRKISSPYNFLTISPIVTSAMFIPIKNGQKFCIFLKLQLPIAPLFINRPQICFHITASCRQLQRLSLIT